MRDMGIGAIYPKPKTTLANKAHKVYPYLLRDIEVTCVFRFIRTPAPV
jgi:putative transposase